MATATLPLEAPAALDDLEVDVCSVCDDVVTDPDEAHHCPTLEGPVHPSCHVHECTDHWCWEDTDSAWHDRHQ